MGVPTFGNLRIEAYLQLPAAYRSLSRPSSAPNAKAFSICSSSLELPYVLIHRIKHNCSQFFIAWIAVCFILCSYLEQIDFFFPPLAKLFVLPFSLTKKPDFEFFIDFFVFSLYFCLSCMSHWFFSESICLYLIRFSMNFSLTFIKLYSIMNFFITL